MLMQISDDERHNLTALARKESLTETVLDRVRGQCALSAMKSKP
jgi:hypothetical protein